MSTAARAVGELLCGGAAKRRSARTAIDAHDAALLAHVGLAVDVDLRVRLRVDVRLDGVEQQAEPVVAHLLALFVKVERDVAQIELFG